MNTTTLRNMKCGIIMTVVILMISVVTVTAQSVTAPGNYLPALEAI